MEFKEYTGKNPDDALTNALVDLGTTSDKVEWNIIDKGSAGILGIGSRPAKIEVRVVEPAKEEKKPEKKADNKPEKKTETKKTSGKKPEAKQAGKASGKKEEEKTGDKKGAGSEKSTGKSERKDDGRSPSEKADEFLKEVFNAMDAAVETEITFDEENLLLDINLKGDDTKMLIGRRGQTLDSLQYLVSLVVNRTTAKYIRVKIDTENYRERRKETLENLAGNIANKVRKTGKPVSLEPMNPYERRIIHSALQNNKYVTTKSEGSEPYRHVVVVLKEGVSPERPYEKKRYNRH